MASTFSLAVDGVETAVLAFFFGTGERERAFAAFFFAIDGRPAIDELSGSDWPGIWGHAGDCGRRQDREVHSITVVAASSNDVHSSGTRSAAIFANDLHFAF